MTLEEIEYLKEKYSSKPELPIVQDIVKLADECIRIKKILQLLLDGG